MAIFDYYFAYRLGNENQDQQDRIKKLTEGQETFKNVSCVFSRAKLLSQALPYAVKSYAENGDKDEIMGLKKLILDGKYSEYCQLIKSSYIDKLSFRGMPSTQNLPFCSFYLEFKFTLAKPFISKDDDSFYICDNPIRKDKVFKVPMISASTWKGNMRWVAGKIMELNPDQIASKTIQDLFGNKKGEDDDFRRGRLSFYPTFFNRIALEVINPHDRKTKAGTLPIPIECVPENTPGVFRLLYVPFDLLGMPIVEIQRQCGQDFELIFESLKEMMLTYGFSAKKSSGYGVVKDEIIGSLNFLPNMGKQLQTDDLKNQKFSEFIKKIKEKLIAAVEAL